jgi:hypothetical protein
VRRPFLLTVPLLIAWLGLSPELASGVNNPVAPIPTYTYDSHHRPADSVQGTAELGLPAAYGDVVPVTPSTVGSHGSSVRHETPPAYGYITRANLAQIDGTAPTTRAGLGPRASADLRAAADATVATKSSTSLLDDASRIGSHGRPSTEAEQNFMTHELTEAGERSNFIIAVEVDPADADVTTEQLWARNNSIVRAGRRGSTVVTGTRGGVDIRIILRNGDIVTGYPTNLARNP